MRTYVITLAAALLCAAAGKSPARAMAPPQAASTGTPQDVLGAYQVKSPDGRLVITAAVANGAIRYAVSANGVRLITSSYMGLDCGPSGMFPSSGWKVSNVVRRRTDDVWKPVWGKRATVRNRYNETTVQLQGPAVPFNKLHIVIRAYNDGVAFRYEVPEDAGGREGVCEKELTTFDFAGDYTAWFYNGEHANLGPGKLTDVQGNRRPVMTVKAADNAYMAILEADLRSGSPLALHSEKGERSFSVTSAPGVIKPGYVSAWRVVLYGETPGALVDAHVTELLNPAPPAGADFSWVKPGVALWNRRVEGVKADGFTYYVQAYDTWVRLVDFAAKSGIPYLQMDSGWYGDQFSRNSDPVNGGRAAEIRELIAYARTKGVKVLLYMNDLGSKDFPLEETFRQYRQWGVAGIKYGFMRGPMAERNTRTRMITELCAKYQLLCNFHDGPVAPYGQMRTWPNAITREYNQAQLDALTYFQPSTFVTTVFVNMLAGPLDMTNGVFDLMRSRPVNIRKEDQNMYNHVYKGDVPSTVTAEAARTLITFSGLTTIPDVPENYEKFPELFAFVAAEKMPWKDSRTLLGEIGGYIVMARQAADGAWLVGAANNETARDISIPLHFLGKGKYEVTIMQDGDGAHYKTNRTAAKTDRKILRSSDHVPVRLAAGGGACLLIKKKQAR
ncbi:glycoside hydrolase family 97 protein [Chitinophaga alhagiae]|uniref:glycoside hydrolase family 97 protein n=1 Tax=Chitinophaga alhagiae TaxID=2203219 RepID=UPI0018E574F2|nr:glycoside hydrolase family 97 protein [Chitinophaga alhagiae]